MAWWRTVNDSYVNSDRVDMLTLYHDTGANTWWIRAEGVTGTPLLYGGGYATQAEAANKIRGLVQGFDPSQLNN